MGGTPPLPPPPTPPPPPPPLPAAALVQPPPLHVPDRPTPCARCGYDLRGLPVESQCPECGLAILRTIAGWRLDAASPEYLITLRTGLLVIIASALASLVTTVVSFVLPAALVGQLLGFGVTAISLWGYWLVTQADPREGALPQPNRARRAVRASVLVRLLGNGLALSGMLLGMVGVSAVSPEVVVGVGMIIAAAGWVGTFFSMMLYVRWLALRVPDPTLAGFALAATWVLPLVFVLLLCVAFIGPLLAVLAYVALLGHATLRVHQALAASRRALGMEVGKAA